jgi:hypothetical protein
MKQLAAVQLVGNALILYLGYYWLGVGEARAGLLIWSFAVALLAACLFLWLHGAGLLHGRNPQSSYFRDALLRLPVFLGIAIAVLLIYVFTTKLQEWLSGPAFTFASWLTLKLRKPVKPAAMLGFVAAIFWVIRWIVLPVVLAPWVVRFAARGRTGPTRPAISWKERALIPILLLAALWLPLRLLAWHPIMTGYGIEMTSFIVRVLIAYLLFVLGLMALEGMPLFTQRKSVGSP